MRGFKKLEGVLERVLIWSGSIGLLSTAFSWVAKHMTVFGAIGWPEAFFIGLGAALLTSLALSVGLLAWRYWRTPSATASPTPVTPNQVAVTDMMQATVQPVIEQVRAVERALDTRQGETVILAAMARLHLLRTHRPVFNRLVAAAREKWPAAEACLLNSRVGPGGEPTTGGYDWQTPLHEWKNAVSYVDRAVSRWFNQPIETASDADYLTKKHWAVAGEEVILSETKRHLYREYVHRHDRFEGSVETLRGRFHVERVALSHRVAAWASSQPANVYHDELGSVV